MNVLGWLVHGVKQLNGSRLVRLAPQRCRTFFWRMAEGTSTQRINGSWMYLPKDHRYRKYLLSGYERGTTNVLRREVRPGMVVCDIGAQLGYHALFCAKQVGATGRVIAFEPEPENAEALQRSVTLNGYRHVTVIQKAVADKSGRATLFRSEKRGCHSLYAAPEAFSGQEETIDVVALGDFLPSTGVGRVDFLKMDVEGAELKVLLGMGELLDSVPPPKMILECNPERLRAAGASVKDLSDLLSRHGFRRVQVIGDEPGVMEPWDPDKPIATSVNLFCEAVPD